MMKSLRRFVQRLAGLLLPSRRASQAHEFDAELESHLAMHTEDNLRAGMTPETARREALLKLGGVELTRQTRREGGTIVLVEDLRQDIHFALRQLGRNPGFAFTAVLVLSLGICASVAIFSFVDAVLIKPLPYLQPSRLVGLFETNPLLPQAHLSYLDYLDWKKMNKVFTSVEAFDNNSSVLNTPSGIQPVDGAIVADGFFRALGVAPMLGRDFQTGEDAVGAPRTVILSYAAWQNRFGGRADVLGQTVTLNGNPNVIIGVLPREFYFAPVGPAEFWATLHIPVTADRGEHGLLAIGRLKDNVSMETASADVASIAQQLAKQYPDDDGGRGSNVLLLTQVISGNLRPILLLLLGGAALLFAIACVNVSSLLLVRVENRRHEIALREALGASRSRLIRQFIVEGTSLVAVGALLGVGGAYGAILLLRKLLPEGMLANMPYLRELGLNPHVLLFAAAMALVAAVLFSLTPMARLSFSGLRDGMTATGRTASGTLWRSLGARLVVVELCIAMVLLTCAGLLTKSFYLMLHEDMGLQTAHLAMLHVRAAQTRAATDEQTVALTRQIAGEVQRLPGVQSVAIAHGLPLGDSAGNSMGFEIVGKPGHGEGDETNVDVVGAGYFTTVQARLLKGRFFTEREDASQPRVAIVNQTFAQKYLPGEDALNKELRDDEAKPVITIVGVVNNIKEGPLDAETHPVIYMPLNQRPDRSFYVIVRTAQSPQAMPATIAATLHQIDPGLLTSGGETMTSRIDHAQATYLHRSSAWLVGGFAALALLLGIVGIYGVVDYSVSRRTREIGVRMALGAQRNTISRLILNEACWLVAAGVLSGAALSVAAARLMASLLFHVAAWDIPTLLGVAAVLAVAAGMASYLPARHAASVNPVEALRAE